MELVLNLARAAVCNTCLHSFRKRYTKEQVVSDPNKILQALNATYDLPGLPARVVKISAAKKCPRPRFQDERWPLTCQDEKTLLTASRNTVITSVLINFLSSEYNWNDVKPFETLLF